MKYIEVVQVVQWDSGVYTSTPWCTRWSRRRSNWSMGRLQIGDFTCRQPVVVMYDRYPELISTPPSCKFNCPLSTSKKKYTHHRAACLIVCCCCCLTVGSNVSGEREKFYVAVVVPMCGGCDRPNGNELPRTKPQLWSLPLLLIRRIKLQWFYTCRVWGKI